MRIRCPTTVSTASTSSRSVARRARERDHRKRQKEQHSRRRVDTDADADADARQDDDHPPTRRGRAEHASSAPHAYPGGGRRPMATKQELRQARMRQLREEAAARRAEEQSSSPLKRGWQFIYNNFMPAFGFAGSGETGDEMPPPPETPTRSRPRKTYNTPGAFPGMTIDSDTESASPSKSKSKSPDVEMSDETQSPSPAGSGSAKATNPDSASFSSTTPSSSSGNRSSFYAFPSTSSAATSTEDFFASRSHTCNSANCTGGYYYNDPDNSFRVFHDCHFAGNEEEMFSREEKEAERSRKRAEDRRKREEEEHERERERMRRDAEKERCRRREAEEREQFRRQREEQEQEQERKQREKRERDEADYTYIETIFAPIAEMEMQQARERGETEEQLRARQWRIWEEWDALVQKVRWQREEKERLEREYEREERRRKEREEKEKEKEKEKARKEREESERRQREQQHSNNKKPKSKSSSSKQSRPHPYARSTNANRKRGGLHFEPSDDPFERATGGGDSPFTRGCRRPNFRKPNFGASRAKANTTSNSKPTAPPTSTPSTPIATTPGAGPSSKKKKYSKDATSYFEWYESEWMSINSLQPAARPLTFKDIPWALVQMPSLPDQVTSAGVKAFMVSRHSSSSPSPSSSASPLSRETKTGQSLPLREKRAAAKRELMNWHPDKFATRVLGRVVDPAERELIRAAADVVQKVLTEYMREP